MKQGVAPYVPKETLERVIKAQSGANACRDRAILYLSHYLGLRAKELAALRIKDVFDQSGIKDTIRLLASMTKGEKFREVFLVKEEARETLRLYLAERGVRHLEGPLFLSQKGGSFSANTMQRLMRNLYDKAKVEASSHSGRRSFATRLIQAGADIYTVQQMMGHASIATTQRYFATSPERLKRAAALL